MKKKTAARDVFQMRVTPELMARIEDWRRRQAKIPTVTEAVKFMIEKAIERDLRMN